jgi:signal transduction histidine kinase
MIRVDTGRSGLATVQAGDVTVPVDRNGEVWFRWSAHDPSRFLSARAVLAGTADRVILGRPIVLIGASAAGLTESLTTPLGSRMSGVESQAQILESALAGTIPHRLPSFDGLELLCGLLLAIGTWFMERAVPIRWLIACLVPTVAMLPAGAWYAFASHRLLVDASFPILAIAAMYLVVATQTIFMEQRLRQRREAKLQGALLRAEQAERAKTAFIAGVSHELRTPLTAILGFSDLMRRRIFGEHSSPKYLEYAELIFSSGEHLLSIVNDLLDIARIDLGQASIHDGEIDLVSAIDACLRMMQPRADTKGVTISNIAQPRLSRLRGDERLVKQMLLNLLSNAVKFTKSGGNVAVGAVLEANGGLTIEVADTGIGIAASEINRIVNPFEVGDSQVTTNPSGIGLGLSLTREMIELHGGMLEIRSQLDVGTTVRLRFPPDRTVKDPAAS